MRTSQRTWLAATVAVVVLAASGIASAVALGHGRTVTITADFPEAPGLYEGNHVDVLGIPVGTVTAIIPHPRYVEVRMTVPSSVAIPAGVSALLEAPDVVNDRFVELNPAYKGGPRLASGAVIPLSRTAVPITTDQILGNLDHLVRDLGPSGANRHGAVSAVIAQLARVFGGNGANLNRSIAAAGAALGALGRDGPQLTALINDLAAFTRTAAADSGPYQTFIDDLAAVTSELAADSSDIGSALHNLQTSLAAIASFVAANRGQIGVAVGHLETFFAELARRQRALAATIGAAPTALSNLVGAIDMKAPGGPALVARYDPTTGSTALVHQVCGNTLLRLLVVTIGNPTKATPLDVVCGFSSVIENLGVPPGAPSGPATTLQTLTGRP